MWWIILLAAIGGILVAAVLVLSMPVDLDFAVDTSQSPAARGSIAFAFGLVRKRLNFEKREKPPEKKRRTSPNWRKLLRSGFLTRLFRLAARLFRTAKIRRLSVEARVGLGDAAETGMLWAAVAPLTAVFSTSGHVRLTPDWSDTPVFRANAVVQVRLWPIRMLLVLVPFAATPSTWRGIRAMRSAG